MARCLEDDVDVRFGSLADMTAPISYVRYPPDCVAKLGSFWRRGSAESFGDPVCRSAVEGVAALAPTATTAAPMLGKRLRTMVERG